MRCTSDQLTQLDLIHMETGVSTVALSPDDLEMFATTEKASKLSTTPSRSETARCVATSSRASS